MTSSDENLRSRRVVFYKETVDQIDTLLKEFLRLSKSRSAFFIDREGHLVTMAGNTGGVKGESLAALVAGSFSATRELARVLGESEFSSMSHKGDKAQINIVMVGRRSMIVVLFDAGTTAGLVSMYLKELSDKLVRILDVAERQQALPAREEEKEFDEDYNVSLQEKLDQLFED